MPETSSQGRSPRDNAPHEAQQTPPAIPTQASLPARAELPMNLLAVGIPLTLLLDLAETFGPPSSEICANEHPDDDTFLSADRAADSPRPDVPRQRTAPRDPTRVRGG